MSDKKKGWVPKTFKDAGTTETFEGGREHEFDAGAFANYLAAGKVLKEKPKAEKAESAPPPAGGKTPA
ncbi:hypothetical protein A4X03_0g9729 [Tilletia caries]|uniref:Uncharacterized protein n=1 Tax=Tilletia caries TaxID=13290 RepID=A0A8T8S9I5_9BASI|nr:hypothetical protein A4X03_0g9729 [Tilletia caries]